MKKLDDLERILIKKAQNSFDLIHQDYFHYDMGLNKNIYYHYTNKVGLKGILSTKTIYLRNYKSLDDKRELHYAIDRLSSWLVKQEKNNSFLKDLRESMGLHLQIANSWRAILEKALLKMRCYSTSFCSSGNSLYLRKNYGSYAIGFKKEFFERVFLVLPDNKFINAPTKIFYSDKTLKQYLRRILAFIENNHYDYIDSKRALYLVFLSFLSLTYSQHKSPYFKQEKETRICRHFGILSDVDDEKCLLDFELNDIAKIVVSPIKDYKLNACNILKELGEGFEHIEVAISLKEF